MADWLLPAVFAVFIWWFSTGVVILLDGLPHRTFRWSLVISSLLAIGALLGLAHTASQTSVAGAYCAFTCALLLWGWHELSFLTGWITGPRKWGHTEGCSRWRHALQAITRRDRERAIVDPAEVDPVVRAMLDRLAASKDGLDP